MPISRRSLMLSTLAAPLLARMAVAQTALMPIVFVHGNGDHAALWQTTLWRFESNGWPRDRLAAFNFLDPLARSDDAVAQPGRSGTADQLRELAAVVAALRERHGGARVALIGSSRGGYAIRGFVVEAGGAAAVSHAILCGVPNRGVFDWDALLGSEFNGRGAFLKKLNGRDSDVVADTAFLTLRSDGNDKFAQPDGRFVGRPGVATGISSDGPMLRGATNIALGDLDHREVAFHAKAFREMLRFLVAREPASPDVAPEANVTLDGLVTGAPGAAPTNRPVQNAKLDIFRVNAGSGERQGEAILAKTTGADGRWGPLAVSSADALEFVVAADGHPITHIYRSPFPRSSDVVMLRPGRSLADAEKGAGAVVLFTRPRGYFGVPRDPISIDGKAPTDISTGVPTDATTTLRLPLGEAGRAVACQFRDERIVARAWPAVENRLTIAELTW